MINGKSLAIRLLFIALSTSPGVNAYELATHARMTQAAVSLSVLYDGKNPNSQFFKSLGIDSIVLTQSGGFTANPFGDSYYDVSGNTVNTRMVNAFEARFMPVADTELLTLPAWLMRGAIREDDLMWPVGDNPQDDPCSTLGIMRVCNHFYDPINNQPLTIKGVKPCSLLFQPNDIAPQWAMGSTDVFASPGTPDTGRRNHFTVFDAREAMYRALTGKNQNGDDVAPTQADRNKYWATLFRALGDIVHLVQDMGQPQHTRNDMHSGVPGFGHESVYEKYLDCRATGGPVEGIDNYQDYYIDACGSLTYTGYATPVFTKYSDYFSTRDGSGKGLAVYSNRNFFTAGTNLGNNNYSSPPNDRGQYTEERIDSLVFLRGNVTDTQAGGTANIRMTTVSAFDFFLGTYHAYSLNAYNCDDMADLLIPRAVAYSAGFIDYFFRGRIEAKSARHMDTTERSLT